MYATMYTIYYVDHMASSTDSVRIYQRVCYNLLSHNLLSRNLLSRNL